MDRLRQRQRLVFSGFTAAEIEKMEKLLTESREELLSKQFCQKLARAFSGSAGRAGKAVIRWTEVQNWFLTQKQESPSKVTCSTEGSKNEPVIPENHILNKELENLLMKRDSPLNSSPQSEEISNASELEFEAKSSKDGAWYDVESFVNCRFDASGEAEVRVRFIGFGAEEDEWVNVRKAVRLRSVPYEHSECPKVDVGVRVLCLQERRDQAIYYDVCVLEIERKMHDIRGCRCIFRIRYDHDNSEERVRLRRLCYIRTLQKK